MIFDHLVVAYFFGGHPVCISHAGLRYHYFNDARLMQIT